MVDHRPGPAAARCSGWSRSCCGPQASTVWLWLLVVACSLVASTCCSPRGRDAPGRRRGRRSAPVRLGHDDRVAAAGRATRPRAGSAACVRDAWQPTAGATGNRHRIAPRARRPRAAAHPAAPAPPRRPARARRHRALRGPLGLRRPAATLDVPGTVRSLPPFESRKHLPSPAGPAARPRRPRRRPGARAGHRVRLAARVRPRRRRPLHRLARQRPQPQRRGPHLAARARPAGGAGARHLAHLGRAGRATCRGSTPRWTPRCCWPRSPPAPATGSTSWPATGGSAPGCARRGARDVAADLQDTMADLEPVIAEADWSRAGRRGHAVRSPAGARRAAHAARAVRGRGGPAAGAARR